MASAPAAAAAAVCDEFKLAKVYDAVAHSSMEQQYPFAMAAHYNGHSLEDVSWLGGGRDEIFRRDIFGYQNGLHLEMDESRTFSVLLRRKKVGQSNKAAREIVANP